MSSCISYTVYDKLYSIISYADFTLILRVYQQFFDLTLKTHNSWTDDATPNPIFLLKHLTPKVYAYWISADTAHPGGGSELINIQTWNAQGSRYRHHTVMKLVPFECKFNAVSKMGFSSMISSIVLSKLTV